MHTSGINMEDERSIAHDNNNIAWHQNVTASHKQVVDIISTALENFRKPHYGSEYNKRKKKFQDKISRPKNHITTHKKLPAIDLILVHNTSQVRKRSRRNARYIFKRHKTHKYRLHDTDEVGSTGETGEEDETGETDEEDETRETDEEDETRETDEEDETGETDEEDETDEDHGTEAEHNTRSWEATNEKDKEKQILRNYKTQNCPTDGFFPDLNSCNFYHYCWNGTDYAFSCGRNSQVYSPRMYRCFKQSRTNKCFKFDCKRKGNQKIPYEGDNQIYAMCYRNKPIEVFSCPDSMVFYEKSQSCSVKCNAKIVKDPEDCTQFYKCKTNDQNSPPIRNRCPLDSRFDERLKKCTFIELHKCLKANTSRINPYLIPESVTYEPKYPQGNVQASKTTEASPSSTISCDHFKITSLTPVTLNENIYFETLPNKTPKISSTKEPVTRFVTHTRHETESITEKIMKTTAPSVVPSTNLCSNLNYSLSSKQSLKDNLNISSKTYTANINSQTGTVTPFYKKRTISSNNTIVSKTENGSPNLSFSFEYRQHENSTTRRFQNFWNLTTPFGIILDHNEYPYLSNPNPITSPEIITSDNNMAIIGQNTNRETLGPTTEYFFVPTVSSFADNETKPFPLTNSSIILPNVYSNLSLHTGTSKLNGQKLEESKYTHLNNSQIQTNGVTHSNNMHNSSNISELGDKTNRESYNRVFDSKVLTAQPEMHTSLNHSDNQTNFFHKLSYLPLSYSQHVLNTSTITIGDISQNVSKSLSGNSLSNIYTIGSSNFLQKSDGSFIGDTDIIHRKTVINAPLKLYDLPKTAVETTSHNSADNHSNDFIVLDSVKKSVSPSPAFIFSHGYYNIVNAENISNLTTLNRAYSEAPVSIKAVIETSLEQYGTQTVDVMGPTSVYENESIFTSPTTVVPSYNTVSTHSLDFGNVTKIYPEKEAQLYIPNSSLILNLSNSGQPDAQEPTQSIFTAVSNDPKTSVDLPLITLNYREKNYSEHQEVISAIGRDIDKDLNQTKMKETSTYISVHHKTVLPVSYGTHTDRRNDSIHSIDFLLDINSTAANITSYDESSPTWAKIGEITSEYPVSMDVTKHFSEGQKFASTKEVLPKYDESSLYVASSTIKYIDSSLPNGNGITSNEEVILISSALKTDAIIYPNKVETISVTTKEERSSDAKHFLYDHEQEHILNNTINDITSTTEAAGSTTKDGTMSMKEPDTATNETNSSRHSTSVSMENSNASNSFTQSNDHEIVLNNSLSNIDLPIEAAGSWKEENDKELAAKEATSTGYTIIVSLADNNDTYNHSDNEHHLILNKSVTDIASTIKAAGSSKAEGIMSMKEHDTGSKESTSTRYSTTVSLADNNNQYENKYEFILNNSRSDITSTTEAFGSSKKEATMSIEEHYNDIKKTNSSWLSNTVSMADSTSFHYDNKHDFILNNAKNDIVSTIESFGSSENFSKITNKKHDTATKVMTSTMPPISVSMEDSNATSYQHYSLENYDHGLVSNNSMIGMVSRAEAIGSLENHSSVFKIQNDASTPPSYVENIISFLPESLPDSVPPDVLSLLSSKENFDPTLSYLDNVTSNTEFVDLSNLSKNKSIMSDSGTSSTINRGSDSALEETIPDGEIYLKNDDLLKPTTLSVKSNSTENITGNPNDISLASSFFKEYDLYSTFFNWNNTTLISKIDAFSNVSMDNNSSIINVSGSAENQGGLYNKGYGMATTKTPTTIYYENKYSLTTPAISMLVNLLKNDTITPRTTFVPSETSEVNKSYFSGINNSNTESPLITTDMEVGSEGSVIPSINHVTQFVTTDHTDTTNLANSESTNFFTPAVQPTSNVFESGAVTPRDVPFGTTKYMENNQSTNNLDGFILNDKKQTLVNEPVSSTSSNIEAVAGTAGNSSGVKDKPVTLYDVYPLNTSSFDHNNHSNLNTYTNFDLTGDPKTSFSDSSNLIPYRTQFQNSLYNTTLQLGLPSIELTTAKYFAISNFSFITSIPSILHSSTPHSETTKRYTRPTVDPRPYVGTLNTMQRRSKRYS